MDRLTRSAVGVSAAAVLALSANAAQAGGFALRDQSTYYQGTSFAGAAAGGTLSSMFWNPATLSEVGSGISSETNLTFIVPDSVVTVTGVGSQGDITPDAFLPGSYGGYRINERLAIGFSANAPFGLKTKFPLDSPLRTFGIAGTSEVFSLNVTPTLAYSVNDWLSVGVGLQAQYFSVRYTAAQLGAPYGMSNLDVDDIALGFTAGLQITPTEGTSIGLGFRSRIQHDMEGTLDSAALGALDATAGLTTPDTVTLSASQRVTDAFTLMGTVEWANWNNLDTVDVTGVPVAVSIPFNYEDGWFFSAGGEYQATQSLSLRGGIGYELSPVTDVHRTHRLPDNDRWWFSAGASYSPNEDVRFDLGYSYILPKITPINSFDNGGPILNGPFQGTADADFHVISFGVNIALGDGLRGLFGGR